MVRVSYLISLFLTRKTFCLGLLFSFFSVALPMQAEAQGSADVSTLGAQELDTSIDAVNTMVNGISAQLLDTSGVRQKTIISVLDDAYRMLDHTVFLFDAIKGERKNHFKLIEVDIRLHISTSFAISGDFVEAKEQIETAQLLYNQLCAEEKSSLRTCILSGIRIKITKSKLKLVQRQQNGALFDDSHKSLTQALDELTGLINAEQKRQRTNQNLLDELHRLRARVEVILVRTQIRHALLLSGAAQTSKARQAVELAKKCVAGFSALVAKNTAVSKSAIATNTAPATQNDVFLKTIGACSNLQALALHMVDAQSKTALATTRNALAQLTRLASRRKDNIPIVLEHIYARFYLGFMQHEAGSLKGADLDLFLAALVDFKELIALNPDNYMLRARYNQLSTRLVDGAWFKGLRASDVFYKRLVEVLENRADYLTQRVKQRQDIADENAQRETAFLREQLAKTLEELLFRYYLGDKKRDIIKRFKANKALLPLPEKSGTAGASLKLASSRTSSRPATAYSVAYMASTMEVYYWVAQALHDEKKEKQSLQVLLTLEEHSRKMMFQGGLKRAKSGIKNGVFSYFYAFAIRFLGAFDLENTLERETEQVQSEDQHHSYEEQVDLENLLKLAKQRIENAANRDRKNQEFRYAQAQITYKYGHFQENRLQLEAAGVAYRHATNLGSKQAAARLSEWYRNATGPLHTRDIPRAERYTQLSRKHSVLEYSLSATSPLLPGAKKFTIYLLPGIRGKRHIAAEKSRLRRYYGVASIDQKTESWLGDLYDDAISLAGGVSRMTINDLEQAQRVLKRERKEQAPFEGFGIESELMASRNELDNGDHAKALAKLQAAKILSAPHLGFLDPDEIKDLGIAALQFLHIAETIDRSSGANNVSRRAKKASHRALRRIMEDTGYQQAGCDDCKKRYLAYAALAERAFKMFGATLQKSTRVSYELNVDYLEKYRVITLKLQQRAIDTTISYRRIDPGLTTLLHLQLLYRNQGVYYFNGWALGDPIQQDKYRQGAMNAFKNGQSIVSQLRQRRPSYQAYQALDMELGVDVVDVHISHGEHKVSLRLIQAIVEEIETLQQSRSSRGNNVKFLSEAAKVHVKAGNIEWEDAKRRIKEHNRIVELIPDLNKSRKTSIIKILIKFYKDRLDKKKAYIEGLYSKAVGNYEAASKLYQEIIAANPGIRLENDINKMIRGIVELKIWYADNLYDPNKDSEQYEEVRDYLDAQVNHWKEKVEKTGDGPEARQFRWYYARTLALRADIERSFPSRILRTIYDGQKSTSKKKPTIEQLAFEVPQKSYAEAQKTFEKIRHMSDIIKADYAMFLNNLGFFYLMNNKDAKAIDVLKTAYGFWKKLPYGVWAKLKVSDLNIPANYAHSLLVQQGGSAQAKQIYRKYKRRQMRLWKPGRTWNDLIISDLEDLGKERRNELHADDIIDELRQSSHKAAGR